MTDYLSRRSPGEDNKLEKQENIELDISNNAYEIGTLNSNNFDPKEFTNCRFKDRDTLKLQDLIIDGYDMKYEQSLDRELDSIKLQLQSGKTPKSVENKYILIDDILYYISKADSEPVLRLYVPLQLRQEVVNEYHNKDHLGVNKTYDAIKYFWPRLHKELYVGHGLR